MQYVFCTYYKIILRWNMTRIRDLREDRDLRQIDIAKILNMTQAQYSRIEKEVYELSYKGLIELADFYKVSIDYILCRTNKKEVNR